MRVLTLLFASLLSFSAFAETIVFRNANVVSMTSPKVAEKQSVVVVDGKIASIVKASAPIPAGATVIDATGKYVMPGLADMHGHLPPPNSPAGLLDDIMFLYLANGATTLRVMNGYDGQTNIREYQKKGEVVAPNLYVAGPAMNAQTVKSVQDGIDKVKQQKKQGWDLIKIQTGLTLEQYDAIAKTAKAEGMRFGGHIPESVSLLHAMEMGHETFDHLDGFVEYLNGEKGPIDPKKLAEVVKRSKDAGIWVVPTNALWNVFYNGVELDELREYPELRYLPAGAVDSWTKLYNDRDAKLGESAQHVLENRVKILNALYKGGVRILLGTDAPQQFTVPGFSLHREIAEMKKAGMTNFDILKAGTVNAGLYFAKQDSFGTIEPGKRADLLLLGGNPLTDIANVDRIEGVMVRGRWFSRADLDAKLEKIEAKYPR
ncbi:MAG: amidohydrolase family protein [Acidobacteriota bacterium]|nr:amidohydrolase family protein [Acidobacteriota bacterium]